MLTSEVLERRTNSDLVFETLYDQIIKLELLPGTKMSEADIARRFGLSRQPVREAFTRLANLKLLLIRAQRATIVRPFSREIIANARFIRAAIELEVVRAFATQRDKVLDATIQANMAEQKDAVDAGDAERFHSLDYDFHRLLCEAAGKPFAFQLIAENKAQVDRLCMLSLTDQEAMGQLYADHEALLRCAMAGDVPGATEVLRTHLERLTPTISEVYAKHRAYFEG